MIGCTSERVERLIHARGRCRTPSRIGMNRHDCITMSLPDLGPAGSWGKGEHLKRLGDVHSDMVAPSTGSSRVGLATIRQARVGSERNAALWETLPVRIEHIRFVGSAGAELAGVLRWPNDEIVGSALVAHCFTCGKDLHTTARLSKALTRAGWLTMTFDFTGLGESGGAFATTTVGTEVGDLTRAAVALIERNAGPCLVIGHSLGGAAAVLAASRLKTVNRVVAIASPAEVTHVERLFADAPRTTDGSACATIGGRTFRIGPAFQADLERHDVLRAAAALGRPFLVVEAGADEIVGADQTRRLAAAGGGEIISIEGADHLFSGSSASGRLADAVLGWLEQT